METLDKLIDELSAEADCKTERLVGGDFETLSRLEPAKPDLLSRRQKRSRRKPKERELDPEEKLTIDALRLRGVLDPKRFFKNKATENISKDFQIGVVEDVMDRATRKERKQTLVDELIADAQFKKNVKDRYHRLKATDAIRKKERALAERRKMMVMKKKA